MVIIMRSIFKFGLCSAVSLAALVNILPVYSQGSTWIPITSNDIMVLVPDPSVDELDSTNYQVGSTVSISVGSVSSTQGFYYRDLDLSTGLYGAWQCQSASDVSANNNALIINDVGEGNYQYQVSACMTGSGCDVSAFETGNLSCSENQLTASIEVNDTSGIREPSVSSNKDDHIDTTLVNFRVSESGAATYSVPISLPPGTAGVQPQVSINYSSQSGDGYMGRGWNLMTGGLISRCPKSIVHDGLKEGVTYSNSDRLCLNGQRLIKNGASTDINTTDAQYWAEGAAYHTEIDDMSLVKPFYSY